MISYKYPTYITPAGWTFSTWGIIYIWQAAWLIFNIVTIFKKTEFGYMYQSPEVLTIVFHIIVFLNFISNITWLFLWDNSFMSVNLPFFSYLVFFRVIFFLIFKASLALLICITGTLYAALFFSHRNIYNAELRLNRHNAFLWLYRLLVNNGLAFYATWVTIATMLNLAIAIEHEWFSKLTETKSVSKRKIFYPKKY